jgi:hypothetical protein
MAAAVLRMRTCVILAWLLATMPVAYAAGQTISLRLGAPTAVALMAFGEVETSCRTANLSC